MLQEATHDRNHGDVFTDAGHARTQATDPAHVQFDLHSRPVGFVEFQDHLRVHETVEFGANACRATRAGVGDLPVD